MRRPDPFAAALPNWRNRCSTSVARSLVVAPAVSSPPAPAGRRRAPSSPRRRRARSRRRRRRRPPARSASCDPRSQRRQRAPPASPTSFTSKTYGYSLTVPAGWTAIQATAAWDGKGAPFHDVPEADQFVGPAAASAWFFGAPTTKDLAARVKESIAANAAGHGNTCPPVPEIQDPIEIGGEPGILLGYNCGILINSGDHRPQGRRLPVRVPRPGRPCRHGSGRSGDVRRAAQVGRLSRVSPGPSGAKPAVDRDGRPPPGSHPHPDPGFTLTVSFRHADQLPAASFARTAIVQVPVANENTFVRPVTASRADHGCDPLRCLTW